MEEDLKASLEWLKDCAENEYIFETGNSKLLLDYITNLQEENQKLKQERQNIDNRNHNQKIANRKLQEEIESVRKNNRTRKNRCRKQTKKKNMYKTRNEKAVEYITTEQLYTNYQWGKSQYVKILKDLLEILQGKSDE